MTVWEWSAILPSTVEASRVRSAPKISGRVPAALPWGMAEMDMQPELAGSGKRLCPRRSATCDGLPLVDRSSVGD